MTINWYPGHMHRTRRLITEHLSKVDIVLEILDARIPESSANPLLSELLGDKPRLVILNKADLADPELTEKWSTHFNTRPRTAALAHSCTEEISVSRLVKGANALCAAYPWFGTRPLRAMVLGVPNVGKSTLINKFIGKHKLDVSNKPAVTKDFRHVPISAGFHLIDTPGILWPKFDDQAVGARLAVLGSIKDSVLAMDTIAVFAAGFLAEHYPELLKQRYRLETLDPEPVEILAQIGTNRGFKMKGGLVDYDRTCRLLVQEIRDGLLGRITWDLNI